MSGNSARVGHRLLSHHQDSLGHNPTCTLTVACQINKKTYSTTCRERRTCSSLNVLKLIYDTDGINGWPPTHDHSY
ncbi:hypothetical protein RhiXN_05358 [Rhizoctonia solani]|uniref:Uncharacterized protein n=1 Tax=Rhizoctonia solani TaxID=456999 RepID=A0A8H8NP34_9AGAM|nr:uncharacterized protein RhiXN_05358 [Rhizoctonia solani]QRW17356.1 hypothetical protein RhiXN_05358 [Rhizoctonia solani]